MTKQEFDRASREAGFGACAPEMWPEIERCYSASDLIDRALMVDIYWHEPALYRTILSMRDEIEALAKISPPLTDEYRFPETKVIAVRLAKYWEWLDEAVAEATRRAVKRASKTLGRGADGAADASRAD